MTDRERLNEPAEAPHVDGVYLPLPKLLAEGLRAER